MSQFCLKWNNHVPNLLAAFENLKSMETLVDVTLSCEGRIVKAHKLVLSAGSKFFQNLFLTNPCAHPVIIMHDIKYNIIKAIIEFMYRGEISVAQENLETLLKTAKTLDIKGLAEINSENSSNAQSSESPNSPLQSNAHNTPQHLPCSSVHNSRKKRIRSRKRSCDSTYSNDDVVPLKIQEPLSPKSSNAHESQKQVNNIGSFLSSTPSQEIKSTSANATDVSHKIDPSLMNFSKNLNEDEQRTEDECYIENGEFHCLRTTTSPKILRNHETSQNLDTSLSDSIPIPSESLNSSHLFDANDSEDGEAMDLKPHYFHLDSAYLNDSDLCTVFQRCRNPTQFAVNLARMLFTADELRESNCRGVKDKSALDRRRLTFIRTAVLKFYNISPAYELDIWKQCMQSIDSRCRHERRPKFRNAVIAFGFSDEN